METIQLFEGLEVVHRGDKAYLQKLHADEQLVFIAILHEAAHAKHGHQYGRFRQVGLPGATSKVSVVGSTGPEYECRFLSIEKSCICFPDTLGRFV
jgi:hypothetical protein